MKKYAKMACGILCGTALCFSLTGKANVNKNAYASQQIVVQQIQNSTDLSSIIVSSLAVSLSQNNSIIDQSNSKFPITNKNEYCLQLVPTFADGSLLQNKTQEEKNGLLITLIDSIQTQSSTCTVNIDNEKSCLSADSSMFLIYFAVSPTQNQDNFDMEFSNFQGCTQTLSFSVNIAYEQPTNLQITANQTIISNKITMKYDEFENITLSAVFENQDNIDPSTDDSFVWQRKLKDDKTFANLDETSNTLTIQKEDIVVGNYIYQATSNADNSLVASIEIVLTSDLENLEFTVSYTNSLEIDLNNLNSLKPINFTAKLSIDENYSVAFYLLEENSVVYKKTSTKLNYSFNPADYNVGEYYVFAKATYKGQTYISKAQLITITNSKKQDSYLITPIKLKTDGNVEVYKLVLDEKVKKDYQSNEIVWFVNGIESNIGYDLTYNATIAGKYQFEAFVYDGLKEKSISTPVKVEVKNTNKNLTWLTLPIIGVTVIGLCVVFIVVSNKSREKIW